MHDPQEAAHKAATLARLRRDEFPVPDGRTGARPWSVTIAQAPNMAPSIS